MATLEKAIEIAVRAHAGGRDKQGQPYILHPVRVMLGVEGEAAQIVAILHDVIEDTDLTLEDIRRGGFAEEVVAALDCVTHRQDQSYGDYVRVCKSNEIARQVKLADLRDNSQLPRLLLRPDKLEGDSARMHRYILSYRFLTDQLDETQYRQLIERYE